jgi:hypothetical protein
LKFVKSNKRTITRDILPAGIIYPSEKDYLDGPEIVYHRKDWGWRNDILETFGWRFAPEEEWKFEIDTPKQVITLIELTAGWLDKERWETEGNSIWEYEDAHDNLIHDICNFAIIYSWMKENPDAYLEFYDSY